MSTTNIALLALAAAGTVQAHPHSSDCASAAAACSAATADANAQLSRELQSVPTALECVRQLLVDSEVLYTEDDLK